MMPNDNIKVVHQHQMVVAWIRLRQMKKLKETNFQVVSRTVNCSCSKTLVIIKVITINNDSNNNHTDNDKMRRWILDPHNNQYQVPCDIIQQPETIN